MKKIISLPVSAAILLLALPLTSNAEIYKGKIVGHHCAHEGKVCPVDRLDPHITLERDFVLVLKNGDYYFMPQLPRDVKVRHVLEDVTVEGDKDGKYNVLTVEELRAGDHNNVIWSAALQRQVQDAFEYFEAE
ncbi:MAG: hypothetical protein ACWA44_09680 [Thiotrichales bacterium]